MRVNYHTYTDAEMHTMRQMAALGCTAPETAAVIGVPLSAFRWKARKLGLHYRQMGALHPVTLRQMATYARQGFTSQVTAEALGLPLKRLRRAARYYGIVFADRAGRPNIVRLAA